MNKLDATINEKEIYGEGVTVLHRDKTCCSYKISDPSGDAIMTSYRVFPGIELVYNNVHMQTCSVAINPPEDMLEINHCREGRIECEFDNGEYIYIGKGDLSIQSKTGSCHLSCFPLSHYHGVSIVIQLKEATEALSCVLDNICIDLYALSDKLSGNNKCIIMRAKESIAHIFSELYTIPDEIRIGYFKIKVLELLLILSVPHMLDNTEICKYYPKPQVDKVKAIKAYICQNLDQHFTLNELSNKFGIPLTTMKNCFKGVYGTSIYSFVRGYRIQKAALMLKQSDDNILNIAGRVGYNNGSKFAAAFKEIMSISPKEYRNSVVQTEPNLSN